MKKTIDITKGELFFNHGLPIYVNRVSEKFELREHAHEFIEVCYVWEGGGFHYIGDEVMRVTKGDLFYIPIGVSHVFRPSSAASNSHLIVGNCIFERSVLAAMTGSMTDAVGLYRFKHIGTERTSGWLKFREHAHEFGSLFDRMLQECQQARLGFQSMLLAMLLELLILLERRLAGGGESDIQASPDDRMDTIVHYIRARLHEPITLRDVSAQIKLGERQLQRLIQAATGLTFTGLLHKERIDRSCALLKHTAKTAVEIASLAGFHDMKHFHRLFKQLTGMTPVAFRKEAAAAEPPKPDYSS